jgi:hypothetical protein
MATSFGGNSIAINLTVFSDFFELPRASEGVRELENWPKITLRRLNVIQDMSPL